MEDAAATISIDPGGITSRDDGRQEDDDRSIEEPTPSSLLSIHRAALSRLLSRTTSKRDPPDTVEGLQMQVERLKRRRTFLASEMERFESKGLSTTLTEELEVAQDTSSAALPKQTAQHADLATRMHSVRTKRRIAGSHRLAGISLLPHEDENTLGVRLDIGVNGRYVARHVAFFQIVATQDKTFLRLVQHTLPKGVVLKSNMSLEIQNKQIDDGTVIERLREWVGTLYDASYAYALRRAACLWLSSKNNSSDDARSIYHVTFNDTYDMISFRLVLWRQDHVPIDESRRATCLDVKLSYENPLVAQPTRVKIRHANLPFGDEQETVIVDHMERENQHGEVPEVSDNDDDGEGETFEGIKNMFMLLSVPRAVEDFLRVTETTLD